ncbi:SRPBCC family protein [Emticicia agri]|uniref:Polyketide cyclase n=1 Tax=Emticicia agri TaxID=2492393 RepID=A0A4Q5M1H4_9BACT|nr:SRPBCC family protein [Emticicia agri]RYU95859.1 polyketide cyclase [Emticicia agri]
MKILKTILFVILGIVAVCLIAALFIKKDYAVEKEVIINQPKAVVFDYIKMLKNQDNFSVWAKMDPAMKKEYKGTDGTVGFVSAWDSEDGNVGKGEQEIKNIVDGERVDYNLHFIKPFDSSSDAYMVTESVDSTHTKVKWGFVGRMAYPTNLMLAFMDMNEAVGKDFATGLTNLKGLLEK